MFPDLTRDDVFRLETRRLWLRWPRLADVQALVRLAGEKAVAEMTGRIPHPYTAEHADRFVFETRRNNANGHGLTLVITPKNRPNAAIGAVGIEPDPEHGGPRLGYWLGMPYWGRGIATEAAATILRYAFDRRGVRIVKSGVFVDNPASRRIQDKLGFVALGVSRVRCLARHERVAHIDTAVSRERFLEFRR